jgi:signal transduction histidine kinase
VFSCGSPTENKQPPRAAMGVLDLTDWDFQSDGPVNLMGEYEFYWKQLLGPPDFAKKNRSQNRRLIEVPGYWNDFDSAGEKASGNGFATYRLSVILNGKDTSLALKVLDMGTAFTLFLNGKNVYSAGTVGRNQATSKPQFKPSVIDFQVKDNILEIVFQVSNFHHRKGGAWEPVVLGTEEQIRDIRETRLSYELFLFGSILIMAIYHFGLFALRRKDRSTLFFGIFCLLIALRILTTGERYLVQLLPNISWELLGKLEYLSYYLAVPAFAQYFCSIFDQRFLKTICTAAAILSLIFSALVLVFPLKIFSYTLPLYHIITVSLFIYGIYILVTSSLKRDYHAFIFLAGFFILFLTAINDMLYNESLIETGQFIPLGLFIFIFSQAFLISLRFSKAFTLVERQRRELKKSKAELEIRVRERTADLLEANTSLSVEVEERKQAQEAAVEARKTAEIANRAKSEFLANMSHELRTPLNHILGFTELVVDKSAGELNETQEEYLNDVLHSSNHLLSLINDILDLSKVESGKMELKLTEFVLKDFLDHSLGIVKEKAMKHGLKLSMNLERLPATLKADERKLKQVLYNLLSNAVKFTPAGGSILLSVEQVNNCRLKSVCKTNAASSDKNSLNGNFIKISVSDSGIGLADDNLDRIFKPFEQADNSASRKFQGTGLGLSLTRSLVELHKGCIWAESKGEGQGSTFSFVIPLL